jgi:hypothetical protein
MKVRSVVVECRFYCLETSKFRCSYHEGKSLLGCQGHGGSLKCGLHAELDIVTPQYSHYDVVQ